MASATLYRAAELGKAESVAALLSSGANANTVCGPEKMTALMAAAKEGHTACAKLLVDAGCDIYKKSTRGSSALGLAACDGHTSTVLVLLDAGSEIDEPGYLGGPPLVWAAAGGHCDTVVKLLDRGASINLGDSTGITALHHACHYGFDRIAECLIRRGADVNKVMHKFFDGARQKCLYTPLHCASIEGHHKCVRLLVCAGANVVVRGFQGCTPLHLSLLSKSARVQTEVIELLLASGSDVNAADSVGRTPVYLAAANQASPAALKLLLEAGGNPNLPDSVGASPLSQAQSLEMVKILLAGGAATNAVTRSGDAVLHHMAHKGSSAAIICTLYRAGADPTARNAGGLTPSDVARFHGHTDAATLLDMLATKYSQVKSSEEEKVKSSAAADETPSDKAVGEGDSKSSLEPDIPENRGIDRPWLLDWKENQKKDFLKDRKGDVVWAPDLEKRVMYMSNRNTEKAEPSFVKQMADLVAKRFKLEQPRSDGAKLDMTQLLFEAMCLDESCWQVDEKELEEHACLNCDSMTSRRCSGCGNTYFCSEKCESFARHLCCES